MEKTHLPGTISCRNADFDELIKKHNERADLLMRSILLAWAPLAAEAWQEHLAWEASL